MYIGLGLLKEKGVVMEKENQIAKVLFYIGIAEIVAGFIMGIVFANQDVPSYLFEDQSDQTAFAWSTAVAWWIGSFVTGMLFIGFSEVIEILDTKLSKTVTLLEQIKYNVPKKESQPIASAKENDIQNRKSNISNSEENKPWFVVEEDKEKIHKMFAKKGKKVEDIIKTPSKYHCLIKLDDGSYELVAVGGFKPILINKGLWNEEVQSFFDNQILNKNSDEGL